MFEISDDDESFWEDFPLDGITDQKENTLACLTDNHGNKRKRDEEDSIVKQLSIDNVHNPSANIKTQSNQQNIQSKNNTNVITNHPKSFSFNQNKNNSNEPENQGGSFDPRNLSNSVDSKHSSFLPKSRDSSNTCGFFTPVKKSPHTISSNSGCRDNSLKENQSMPEQSGVEEERIVGHVTPVRKVKRKFPGPAGRLPKLRPGQPIEKLTAKSPEDNNKLPKSTVISSQSVDDGFNESSWHILLEDLGDSADLVLDQFSVVSSLQQASKKLLPRGKIPLLLVMIESIDLQGAGASVVLKDKTGRIKGTLHRDVIKEYGAEIQAGTSLVLRQVSVVSPSTRSHYVNITRNNIVYLNSTNSLAKKKHLFNHKSLSHFISDFREHQVGTETSCIIETGNQNFVFDPNREMPNSMHVPRFDSRARFPVSNHGRGFPHSDSTISHVRNPPSRLPSNHSNRFPRSDASPSLSHVRNQHPRFPSNYDNGNQHQINPRFPSSIHGNRFPRFESSDTSSQSRNQPPMSSKFPTSNHSNRIPTNPPLINTAQRETTLNSFPRVSVNQNVAGNKSLSCNSHGNARLNPVNTSSRITNSSTVIANKSSDSRDITGGNTFPNVNASANISSTVVTSNSGHKQNECSYTNTINPRSDSAPSNNSATCNATSGLSKGDNSYSLRADCHASTPQRSKFNFKSKTPSFSPKLSVSGLSSDKRTTLLNTDVIGLSSDKKSSFTNIDVIKPSCVTKSFTTNSDDVIGPLTYKKSSITNTDLTRLSADKMSSPTIHDEDKYEELWQDDITDELLSHLSEEMI